MTTIKSRKYLIEKEAVCSECAPAREVASGIGGLKSVDAWAKQHAIETGHIVTITETHDVTKVICYES